MENNCTVNTSILAITLVTTAFYIIDNTLVSFYGFVYIFALVVSVVFVALVIKNNTHHKKNGDLQKILALDSLTSLLNRRGIDDFFNDLIKKHKNNDTKFAILYLDLDNFKTINDTLGHHVGDLALIEVSKRLQTIVRENDAVGRIGGDEFVLLIDDIIESEKALLMAQRIIKEFERLITIEKHQIKISFSIGISIFPFNGSDQKTLFKSADIAMYQAKTEGKNDFRFYTDALNASVEENLEMRRKLEKALSNQEFLLLYQPKINFNHLGIREAEALIRWQQDDGTLLSASNFISHAQRSGMIVKIGNWVIDEVCKQVKYYEKKGTPTRISINISVEQLKDSDFIENVSRAIAHHNISPTLIEFEISESILIKDSDMLIPILKKLKELDVLLAIDEFGKGFSSIGYMSRLPIDSIKIDKTLINEITQTKQRELIFAMIALGHAMNLSVTAEGIEIDHHLQESKKLQVDSAQGYFLAKPLKADKLIDFYLRHQAS
jgi:diguanylate cyclase (GGDEF)-like protein